MESGSSAEEKTDVQVAEGEAKGQASLGVSGPRGCSAYPWDGYTEARSAPGVESEVGWHTKSLEELERDVQKKRQNAEKKEPLFEGAKTWKEANWWEKVKKEVWLKPRLSKKAQHAAHLHETHTSLLKHKARTAFQSPSQPQYSVNHSTGHADTLEQLSTPILTTLLDGISESISTPL